MSATRKQEIITFKVDEGLARLLEGLPNRSAFIRSAVLKSLDSACAVCGGTGILSADQRRHWLEFERRHHLEECGDCHAVHLVCEAQSADSVDSTTGGLV